jgi:hypothetical protein
VKVKVGPFFALILASCGMSNTADQRLTCNGSPDLDGADKVRSSHEWQKTAALYAIQDLHEVRKLALSAWFGTGAFSDSLGNIAGTDAYILKSKIRRLESQVADIKAVEFSLEIDGKSPLPSNAEWACRTLAVSIGNLDTGQSDEQFLSMATMLENYLTRTYKYNGGVDLQADLLSLGRSTTKK